MGVSDPFTHPFSDLYTQEKLGVLLPPPPHD
jgi:hypothetical protein